MSRRRQSSAASATRSIALHTRNQSKQNIQPRSPHVADPFLHAFLDPSFDAATYLNTLLPPLQTSARPAGAQNTSQGAVSLAELSIQTQSLLSQLNAHTTRLTNTLTDLTNDILRSGGRLAYEVELLRGETLGLAETFSDHLEDDIAKFVPGGIQDSANAATTAAAAASAADSHPGVPSHQRHLSVAAAAPAAARGSSEGAPPTITTTTTATTTTDPAAATAAPEAPEAAPNEPPYITQLRTLTLVRSRLDSVIKTFGEAMEFVFPPSEVSVSSSFLSVSAPDDTDGNGRGGETPHSIEEKGQRVLQALRDEIAGLLSGRDGAGGGGGGGDGEEVDPIRGVEAAARRVEQLKELAVVWKGTAEERGRNKFIESLAKMVEDRHRELLREVEQASRKAEAEASPRKSGEAAAAAAAAASVAEAGGQSESSRGYGGYGLISQLQKLRGGL